MKNTKKALKEWIRKAANNPTSQRKEATNQLEEIQFGLEEKDISTMDLDKEKYAQRKAYNTFRNEEEYWQLKSRSLWLKAGDRNTTYFHRQFRARLSRNHIEEITTSSGQVCRGFEQIKEATANNFQNLLSARKDGSEEDIEEFLTNIPQLVSSNDNDTLLSLATEEEISNIVWSMEPDKAPGPDGFSIHFYRICWEIIKADLLRMVQGFMRKAKVRGGINSTFLTLIPKEANQGLFDRYRPISLCNSSYKIVAKMLANRIKPLLQKLISPAQGGFVKGRHILDNVIQVQEALHSSELRKEQDSLSRKLTLEKQKGSIPGIRIEKGIEPVNHALFANDSLLLGGGSSRIANNFKTIIQKFCIITGALVSEKKSMVYGWNTDHHSIGKIAEYLGYTGHAEWEKIKYLGLPISLGSNRNPLWEEVISKFKKKTAAWGGFWLSTGGKLTLIKIVLSALPTFQASLLMAPKHISKKISRYMRNFLWNGGRENTNRFHLIGWETVKRPLAKGGLQIHDPVHANLALGCKLLW
eukprot:PITA_36029